MTIDDTALEHDPSMLRRWNIIQKKLEENSESLLTQGGLVPKVTRSGRNVRAVRYVDRSGARPVHHTVYLGGDGRLVELARRQLAAYRALGRLPDEIAGYARAAASASFAVRRLAARPRGSKASG